MAHRLVRFPWIYLLLQTFHWFLSLLLLYCTIRTHFCRDNSTTFLERIPRLWSTALTLQTLFPASTAPASLSDQQNSTQEEGVIRNKASIYSLRESLATLQTYNFRVQSFKLNKKGIRRGDPTPLVMPMVGKRSGVKVVEFTNSEYSIVLAFRFVEERPDSQMKQKLAFAERVCIVTFLSRVFPFFEINCCALA